jgi:hypothetical protein
MRGTGVDIVTRRGKRIDRTRGQTRLIGTVHAWTYTWFIGREFQFFVENKRAPIGVPQPVFRMDCHTGRRDMNRFSLCCPAQEGRIERAVERENRVRAELGGDGAKTRCVQASSGVGPPASHACEYTRHIAGPVFSMIRIICPGASSVAVG